MNVIHFIHIFDPSMFGVHENELFHPLIINQIRNDYISSINVVGNYKRVISSSNVRANENDPFHP
jgi:hypothetical protein